MKFESFVTPKREIMSIFDISKWYKSEVREKKFFFVYFILKRVNFINFRLIKNFCFLLKGLTNL